MIKRLKYIFIPVLAILLMSHNVSAFQITESVQSRATFTRPYWTYRANNYWYPAVAGEITRTSGDSDITGIRLADNNNNRLNVYEGEYIVMHGWVSFSQLVYSNNFINIAGYIGVSDRNLTRNCSIISWDTLSQEYFDVTGNQRYTFDVTCKVLSDNTLPELNFFVKSNVSGLSGSDTVLTMDITGWDIYVSSDSGNKEVEEKTQDAADNSSTAGDSSSSDATSATSSLLSVIGSGISAITTATPSNCKINGNLGNLDIGEIDLCANPVPVYMATIGSFIAVMLVLPLVIILFNRFISIIRSFQT